MNYQITGRVFLSDFKDTHEILADIARRVSDGRRLIVTIGLPQAGKSMFIASLIAFAFGQQEDNACPFRSIGSQDENGVNEILRALSESKVLPQTNADELKIIDLNMESRYRNRVVKVSLIDFAGEDIERLLGYRAEEEGKNNVEKISSILQACVAQRSIFSIITPSNTIGDEDNRLYEFISKLKENDRNLYQRVKFLFILSKWDEVVGANSPQKFLEKNRQNLYREFLRSGRHGLLPFSVGNVVGQTIIRIDLESPKNFWYTLYRWSTGLHVLPWYKRWFS